MVRSRIELVILALVAFLLRPLIAPAVSINAPDGTPFTVSPKLWPVNGLGNHRIIIKVERDANLVRAHLPWRRRDLDFAKKAVIVTPLTDEAKVMPSDIARSDWESGDVVFEPKAGPGLYACYYLPFKFDTSEGGTQTTYIAPSMRPDLPQGTVDSTHWDRLPTATTLRVEARSEFDSFAPMELPANEGEIAKLEFKGLSYWVFPEDRTRPIKMFDRIPALWANRGFSATFTGNARPNEYYVFQLGVCTRDQPLKNVKLIFSDLVSSEGQKISASNLTCFNSGGTNWDGSPLIKRVSIEPGRVLPLWVGVDIAPRLYKGTYRGTVQIKPENAPGTTVSIRLEVAGPSLIDRGDSELWRYSRLRWLNSKLGTTNTPISPFGPLNLKGNRIQATGKSIEINKDGFPKSIVVNGTNVLLRPISLLTGLVAPSKDPIHFERVGTGQITWSGQAENSLFKQVVKGGFEFDGHGTYSIDLIAKQNIDLPDLSLSVPYSQSSSTYFMGAGHRGGFTPGHFIWDWTGPYDSWWVGDVHSGMQVELRGGAYNGPLLNLYHPAPPASWFNAGKGHVAVDQVSGQTTVQASLGARHFKAGEKLHLEFAFLLTPVKKIDTSWQFKTRFYHNGVDYAPVKAAIDAGANVVNVHHANDINPYINYPFRAVDGMRRFVQQQHAQGRKVKIYDTIRELSNYTAELWPLLALDGEIFEPGGGGGFAWLQEHVQTGYIPSWYHPYPKTGTADASLVTTGFSRWINYYVEGLNWLAKNVQIDGLYLDDVSFDRRVLKRMRRVLAAGGREPMIDLHSNTGFSIGPANQYAEFFPYVDRLWFGESFDYNHMSPDRWIVETSGIPFGLMGEMLQGGGNRWLGMVYGMTTRYGWTNYETANNPDPIWHFWDEFGIVDSQMVGYWEKNCPVRVDDASCKATAYIRKDRVLISVANFSDKPTTVHLEIDWKQLGMIPTKATLIAPTVRNFQTRTQFKVGDPISMEAKKGWMIVVAPQK